MADAVNRIVPPSVSLDRTQALGRERERRDKSGDRKKASEAAAEPAAPMTHANSEGPAPVAEENKGKNLDIQA